MPITLPSGLTVHVEENHAAPAVGIQIWVKVGSADETPDEAGIAHLHEHMLFKGTGTRGPGEIARAIEASGGEINAWTSFDQTVYHVVMASRFWETGLAVLADAVTDAAFDPGELSREIEVVCEEIKRSADSPSRVVSQALFGTAFARHPYGLPVIGTEQSVRSHTRERITSFYRRWYRPENIVVIAVGDLREAEFLAAAERHFRWPASVDLSTPFVPAPPRPVEPPATSPRARLLRQDVREAQLTLSWPAPSMLHDDVAALDALGMLLGYGEGSRLARALKRERLLVNDLSASCYTPQDPGLMLLSFSLPGEHLAETVREASRQLHRLRCEEVPAAELERICRLLESDAVYQRETVQGQARKLGYYISATGSLELEERYLAQIASLTPARVREAAARWLEPRAMAGAVLMPLESEPALDEAAFRKLLEEASAAGLAMPTQPAPESAARPLPPRPAARAKRGNDGLLHQEKLPGGGTLLIREERAVPLVAMRVAWNGGLRAESEENAGHHMMLSRLAAKGTAHHTAEQIAHAMEEMGGGIGGNAGRNSFGLRAEVLSRHFPAAWELFAETILEPAFAPQEVERERSLQLDELRARDDNAAGATFQLFTETIFRRHPYRLDMLGTKESLARATPEALARLRALGSPPGAPVLAIVGDVDPGEVRERVLRSLGKSGTPPPKLVPPQELLQTAPRAAVRALEKAQAHLVVGYPGLSLFSPEREALEVLSAVLSGQGGRLFLELRDKKSLAYSVSSFSMEGVDPGYFAVYIGCGPAKVGEALAGIRGELARIAASAPTEQELDRARTHLIGSQAIGLQRNSSRAAVITFDACYGLGADWSKGYAERIAAVTAAHVQTLAAKLLDPQKETVALIAPESALPAELRERAVETAAQAAAEKAQR